MIDSEELPSNHFWDSEEAEQEYHAVEQNIAEATYKFDMARGRVLAATALCEALEVALENAAFHSACDSYESDTPDYYLPKDFYGLNHALNPFWISPDGDVPYRNSPMGVVPFSPGAVMTLVNLERETVNDTVFFGRETKRGEYKNYKPKYAYEKRVEWYSLTGDAAASSLEHAIHFGKSPFKTTNPSEQTIERWALDKTTGDCLNMEPYEVQKAAKAMYESLLTDLIKQVRVFTDTQYKNAVWKFQPNLAPDNTEEIRLHTYEHWEPDPQLSWPPLTKYECPQIGKRYKASWWVTCGTWEPYTFTREVIDTWWQTTRDRLHEQVGEAVKQVVRTEQEIKLLQRRRYKIRILHYKPEVYKLFWKELPTSKSVSGVHALQIEAPATGE